MLSVAIGVVVAVTRTGIIIWLLAKKRGVVEVTPSETLNFSVSDNDRDEALLDTVFVC
jgi:hypothetical protein